jgi:hypothetical protein
LFRTTSRNATILGCLDIILISLFGAVDITKVDVTLTLAGFIAVTVDTTRREGTVDVLIVVDVFGEEAIGESGRDVGADVVKLLRAGVGIAVLRDACAEG